MRDTFRTLTTLATMAALAGTIAVCQAAPRQRPVKGGPTNTGPGSLEAVRRQLQGTWQLTQFEMYPEPGKPVVLNAQALLTYDDFGNLTVKGEVRQALPGESAPPKNPMLNYSGRAVIDPVRQEMRLQDATSEMEGTGKVDPAVKKELDPSRVRKFEFTSDGLLKISILDAKGQVASVATFKRQS